MRKSGGSFGLLLLLIAMGIVFILVTKSFKSSIPTAAEMRRPSQESAADATPSTGESSGPSGISGMRNMKRQTDQHATQVRDALDASP
jgi:hypothetical protein